MFFRKKKKAIWFIIVNGKKQGPFTFEELAGHPDLSPFTMVWKKGFAKWLPIGQVPELAKIFETKVKKSNNQRPSFGNGGEIILEASHQGFFPSIWWILLTLMIFIYVIVKLWIQS